MEEKLKSYKQLTGELLELETELGLLNNESKNRLSQIWQLLTLKGM